MQSKIKDLFPVGKSKNFRVTREKSISIPSEAMQRLGWKYDDQIATSLILDPLTLLMWLSPANRAGYTLHPNGTSGRKKVGNGKLSMSNFVKTYLDGGIFNIDRDAPIDIRPAYLDYPPPYQVALMFETPNWCEEATFTPDAIKKISINTVGVYKLISRQGIILKYGKGWIQQRLLAQCEEKEKRDFVHRFQYFVTTEELAPIFERIHLALHTLEHNDLPLFNKINS